MQEWMTIQVIVVALLAYFVAFLSWQEVQRAPSNVKWLRILQCAIGVYWGVLYTYLLFKPATVNMTTLMFVFFKPGFIFTLGAMAASLLFRRTRAGSKRGKSR